jgi:hypothetical protein
MGGGGDADGVKIRRVGGRNGSAGNGMSGASVEAPGRGWIDGNAGVESPIGWGEGRLGDRWTGLCAAGLYAGHKRTDLSAFFWLEGMRRPYRTPGWGCRIPGAMRWAGIRCPFGTQVGGEWRKDETGLRVGLPVIPCSNPAITRLISAPFDTDLCVGDGWGRNVRPVERIKRQTSGWGEEELTRRQTSGGTRDGPLELGPGRSWGLGGWRTRGGAGGGRRGGGRRGRRGEWRQRRLVPGRRRW